MSILKPILAVSLNSAWQRTLSFTSVTPGAVNRALECHDAGGGKGVNVARVLRRLGDPVAVAAFVGGYTGANLRSEFGETGVLDLTVPSAGATRCCYTIIDRAKGEATELIEPSARISPEEVLSLLSLLAEHMDAFSAVVLSGSTPPGVPDDIYARIAAMAHRAKLPVVLDAATAVTPALDGGVELVKINRGELAKMSAGETMEEQMETLLKQYPRCRWLAVTDGPNAAQIKRQTDGCSWKITLPRLERIVSPIGAGDCATALMARTFAEGGMAVVDDARAVVDAFAHALACASASCLTDTPSVFDEAVAASIHPVIESL